MEVLTRWRRLVAKALFPDPVQELRDIIADPEMPITQDFLKRLLAHIETLR